MKTSIDEVVSELESQGFDFVCIIPCISIIQLVRAIEARLPCFSTTREEEAVGLCAGAYLAGKRPLLVLQNSGIGNSVNALKSLIELYQIPLVMLVSHRGVENEWIEAQVPMGKATARLLDSLDVPYFVPGSAGEVVEAIREASRAAERQGRAAAVLVRSGVMA